MDFITKKWFAESAPQNAVKGKTTIGAGDDGVVTIVADEFGPKGNEYTVQVVVVEGNNKDMEAKITGKNILITLGTGSGGSVASAKNTAILIATAVDALEGVSSTHSGTGATSISSAVSEKAFTGGQDATETPIACAIAKEAEVILADEPSGSLDTHNKEDLHQLFFDLRDRLGQTFVIVTHDEGLAKITDRTVHMVDGMIKKY